MGGWPAARVWLPALALALAGCRGTVKDVDRLVAARRLPEALQRVEKGLLASPPPSAVFWDLALRKAQILERLIRREDALAWLGTLSSWRGATPYQRYLLTVEKASIERDLAQYEAANRDLAAAVAVARAAGKPDWVARADIRQAETYARLGQPVEAQRVLDEADQFKPERPEASLSPYILNGRGLALLLANRFEEAIPPLDRSLKECRTRKLTALSVKVMINLAWCEYRLGRSEEAAVLYNQALPLSSPEDRHLVLGHLGNIFRDRHEYAKAAQYYQQAADLARGRNQDYYSRWLSNLAGTLCDEGQWTQAQRINQLSFAVKKTIQAPRGAPFETLNAARIAAGEGHVQEAEADYQRLLASNQIDPTPLVEGSGRLAQLYAATGRPKLAGHQFEDALAMVDSHRADLHEDENKLSYLAHLIDLHQQYVEFLAGQGDWEKALTVAEGSRARRQSDLPQLLDRP